MTATSAEFKLGGIDIITLWTRILNSGTTVTAILDSIRILKLALRTFHFSLPSTISYRFFQYFKHEPVPEMSLLHQAALKG